MGLAPEMLAFLRAAERILSPITSPHLTDEDNAMLRYYIRELATLSQNVTIEVQSTPAPANPLNGVLKSSPM